MSFWGVLGDIGAGIAAPFTGGASLALIPGINAADKEFSGDNQSTVSRVGTGMADAGSAIGAANQAAGQNRLDQEKLALDANVQNIQGRSAFENALMARAGEEDRLRQEALGNLQLQSRVLNPRVSPFDPTGGPKYSPELKTALGGLATQGDQMLSSSGIYSDPSKWSPMTPYTPIDIKDVQGSTGTAPGFWEKFGGIAGPGLTVGGDILKGIMDGGGGNKLYPQIFDNPFADGIDLTGELGDVGSSFLDDSSSILDDFMAGIG